MNVEAFVSAWDEGSRWAHSRWFYDHLDIGLVLHKLLIEGEPRWYKVICSSGRSLETENPCMRRRVVEVSSLRSAGAE